MFVEDVIVRLKIFKLKSETDEKKEEKARKVMTSLSFDIFSKFF